MPYEGRELSYLWDMQHAAQRDEPVYAWRKICAV